MLIEEIMKTKVVSVSPEDTLRRVRDIFQKTRFHHLLVLDKTRMVGVLSDRDYLQAISPELGTPCETLQDQKTLETKVSKIMTTDVIAVKKDVPVKKAVQLMLVKRVSCLPVCAENGKVIGIVTLKDIMQHYIEIAPDEREKLIRYKPFR